MGDGGPLWESWERSGWVGKEHVVTRVAVFGTECVDVALVTCAFCHVCPGRRLELRQYEKVFPCNV